MTLVTNKIGLDMVYVMMILTIFNLFSLPFGAFRKTVNNLNIECSGSGEWKLVGPDVVYNNMSFNLIAKTPVTQSGYAFFEISTLANFSQKILIYEETFGSTLLAKNDLKWNVTLSDLPYIETQKIMMGIMIEMPRVNLSQTFYGIYGMGLGRYSPTTYKKNADQLISLNTTFLQAVTPFVGNNRGYNVATPMRYEYLHPAAFACTASLYVCALMLTLMLRNHQPLKSRGITGVIMNTFMLLDLFMSMIPKWLLSLEQNQSFKCYYHFFTHTSVHVTLIMICLLHYLRYVILAYLNDRKVELFASRLGKSYRRIPRYIVFLKIFGYWWFQLLLAIAIYLSFCLYYVLWLIPTECEIPTNWSADIGAISTFSLIAMTICVFFAIMALDTLQMILFFAKNRSWSLLWKRIWTQDHLWWRFEFFFVGVLILLPAMTSNIMIYIFHPTQLAMMVTNSINFHAIFLFGSGFSLVITLWNFFRSCFIKEQLRKDHTKNKIRDFLMDKFVLKLFENFAKSEFSVENVYFFKDVMEYKRDPKTEKALEMFTRYLNGRSSELEINIPLYISQEVKDRVLTGNYSETMFDDALNLVYSNLADTYTRFITTRDYRHYVRMTKVLEHGIQMDDSEAPYSLMEET